MEASNITIGFLLSVLCLVALYETVAIAVVGLVIDVVNDYQPEVAFEHLAVGNFEIDISYKSYSVWDQYPEAKTKIDATVKEWMAVPA